MTKKNNASREILKGWKENDKDKTWNTNKISY